MLDWIIDIAAGAVDIVDDVSEEVTGIRPVQDTVTAAVVVTCVICGESSCDCDKD